MWSWHLAQPTVRPMKAVETVSTAVIASSPLILAVAEDGPAREEPQREQVVRPRLDPGSIARGRDRGPGRGPVSGQLGADELVVRQVVVERVDHPVAPEVNPGRGDHGLVDVGIAQDVEPVPRIADAVLLAGEQPVDHLFVGVGRAIAEEGLLLLERGRQPGQVERDAPQQGQPVGRPDGLEAPGRVSLGDEGVDGVGRAGIPLGDIGPDDRLQGP